MCFSDSARSSRANQALADPVLDVACNRYAVALAEDGSLQEDSTLRCDATSPAAATPAGSPPSPILFADPCRLCGLDCRTLFVDNSAVAAELKMMLEAVERYGHRASDAIIARWSVGTPCGVKGRVRVALHGGLRLGLGLHSMGVTHSTATPMLTLTSWGVTYSTATPMLTLTPLTPVLLPFAAIPCTTLRVTQK